MVYTPSIVRKKASDNGLDLHNKDSPVNMQYLEVPGSKGHVRRSSGSIVHFRKFLAATGMLYTYHEVVIYIYFCHLILID